VSTDTTITFAPIPGAANYFVRWRRTDNNQWTEEQRHAGPALVITECRVPGPACTEKINAQRQKIVLPKVRVDDWVFGVSSVSKDGFESPVASAVPGGAFEPYVPPAETK
jgi:hypothetical protein